MKRTLILALSTCFLVGISVAQQGVRDVVYAFPYARSSQAIAPLSAMERWGRGDWKAFFRLFEDDSARIHATYALDAYVHASSRDAARSQAAARALNTGWGVVNSGVARQQLIVDMGRLGDDACVPTLAGMLASAEYSGDAAMALAVIRTASAITALEKAAAGNPGPQKAAIDIALAHARKLGAPNASVKPTAYVLSKKERKAGFELLFDGTHIDRWIGNKVAYAVEDGAIVVKPSGGSGGNLYTDQEYGDFELRFEFMLTPGANNGLGIRTPTKGDAAYVGMELQILDNEAEKYRNLKPYQYHGSVYGVMPAKRGFLKPTGEWNQQTVVAKGSRVQVILNGETILDGDIREASANGTADGNKHPGLLNTKGHIGFLGHGDVVKFRNLRIRSMD
ncbi:MAG: DUF1080 domain-containing protein [Chitinophagia bacterium]|nr:DUF1080 domain-containing protein [Chitinophagia bacterium]